MNPRGYNEAILGQVARPLTITPTISTTQNPRVQTILNQLIMSAPFVNNVVWTIEALIGQSAVGIHLFGEFLIANPERRNPISV